MAFRVPTLIRSRSLCRRVVFGLALAFNGASAQAVCLGTGIPELEALVRGIGVDPAQALTAIDRARAAEAKRAVPARRAVLASAHALAHGMLGQPAEEIASELAELSGVLKADDPALLQLRIVALVMRDGSGGRAEQA
ncbi:MAG: hypothetical protein ACK44A_08665 [Roseateles sp.]